VIAEDWNVNFDLTTSVKNCGSGLDFAGLTVDVDSDRPLWIHEMKSGCVEKEESAKSLWIGRFELENWEMGSEAWAWEKDEISGDGR
jgi:hypothetical protein